MIAPTFRAETSWDLREGSLLKLVKGFLCMCWRCASHRSSTSYRCSRQYLRSTPFRHSQSYLAPYSYHTARLASFLLVFPPVFSDAVFKVDHLKTKTHQAYLYAAFIFYAAFRWKIPIVLGVNAPLLLVFASYSFYRCDVLLFSTVLPFCRSNLLLQADS